MRTSVALVLAISLGDTAMAGGLPTPFLQLYEKLGSTGSSRDWVVRNFNVATEDPAYPLLDAAYTALREQELDLAIEKFVQAIALSPARADIRKDLAYTYFRVGRNEKARQQFEDAFRLDPGDQNSGLELAFLDYESQRTRDRAEAWRIFHSLRQSTDGRIRETATAAFSFIDSTLEAKLRQKRENLERDPANPFVRGELALFLHERNRFEEAAGFYREAIRQGQVSLYPLLGEALVKAGRIADARSELTSALTVDQPYVVEESREILRTLQP